jgi:1,4-alpha-glucan branching enzyme
MRKKLLNLQYLILILFAQPAFGQFNPEKIGRLVDGRFVVVLDNRWTPVQVKEVAKMYALDSLLMADAFSGRHVINDSGTVWTTRKLDNYRIELSKNQEDTESGHAAGDLVFLLEDDLVEMSFEQERESVPFGINRMTRNNIVPLGGNHYRFFLPGQPKARKVFLAGSFNGWSTMQTPMMRTDSGWSVPIFLKPGKYTYKYVIDGKWLPDPFNRQRESDGRGGENCVWFCYNYQFVVDNFSHSKTVYLAGSFNNWNPNSLKMLWVNGKWRINLYLREGTHAYKFIVDGQWMNDPANKVTRPDGRGNFNSFMSVGDTMYFSLRGFPKAEKVVVAGNFNMWNRSELQMQKVQGGWELPYVLAPGNYEYKFLVDGKWIIDPDNPNTTGSDDFTNSVLSVKPNVTFRLDKYPNAENIFVTGSFNGWSKSGYRMVRRGSEWVLPVSLKTGKYLYKFIVDGKFILDPGNELWEENEYGTGNSVLWVSP